MKKTKQISDEEIAPWLRSLRTIAYTSFRRMPNDHDDLVQEAVRIGLTRKLFDKPPTRLRASGLIIDAWRGINKHSRDSDKRIIVLASDKMWHIADPPNQFRDMEIKDKILSPDEQVFQNQLDSAKERLNVALEIEIRHRLGSTPLVPSDLWDLLS